LVASIYRFLNQNEKTLLFVRQREDENNHYLQTLKILVIGMYFVADDAYAKMYEFTGFNLRLWLNENATWSDDISNELYLHLQNKDLLKYLTW